MSEKINLPSVFTENHWAYKEYKGKTEVDLDKFLGKQYISYSTHTSFKDYFEDFVKQKLAKIKLPGGIYSKFGSWIGESLEHGKVQDNPNGFEGTEFIKDIPRESDGVFERIIMLDFGEYFLLGFIDRALFLEDKKVRVRDYKTGGKGKESKYKSEDYVQTDLYGAALEDEGYTVVETDVLFLRRSGSHFRPPLALTGEMIKIPLEFNKEKVEKAKAKIEKTAKEITKLKNTFDKIFGC